MDWTIQKTTKEQLKQVEELYDHARRFMADHGNRNQWGDTYPPTSRIVQDIEEGNSYVCMIEGRIAVVFHYRFGEDKDYQVIEDGQWLNDKPYGVVHRIASDGRSKGGASFCLSWALSKCGNLKIDTHPDNVVMQNLLKKNEFLYCGKIYVRDKSLRLAYQRSLL